MFDFYFRNRFSAPVCNNNYLDDLYFCVRVSLFHLRCIVLWMRSLLPPFVCGLARSFLFPRLFAASSLSHSLSLCLSPRLSSLDALENLLLLLVSTRRVYFTHVHTNSFRNMRAVYIWLGKRVNKCVPRSRWLCCLVCGPLSHADCHTSPRSLRYLALHEDVFRVRKYVVVQK